jgi:hypothetical protein
LHQRRAATSAVPAPAGDGHARVPLEWLGITAPFQPEDVTRMDRVLDLPVVPEEAVTVPPQASGSDGPP